MLADSGEPLEGITSLRDVQSGVSLGFLYRGFTESGRDVIWCFACTARHKMGNTSEGGDGGGGSRHQMGDDGGDDGEGTSDAKEGAGEE